MVDRISIDDPEYIEQKKLWRRDRAHFEFKSTFKELVEWRNDRMVVDQHYGIDASNLKT